MLSFIFVLLFSLQKSSAHADFMCRFQTRCFRLKSARLINVKAYTRPSVYTWDSYVGVYVCRYDLRGLLQRQRGTTRVLTKDTIDSSLLFGLCHDITSRPRPSSVSDTPYRSTYTSRDRLLHSGVVTGCREYMFFFCFSADQRSPIFGMLKRVTSNEINVRMESLKHA